ncbi:hypothetical protein XcuCFBP2542_18550 [Xanthomonas cucurbitae]|uniref:Uncharacterized protein n=1 Tax=Xanthomonas cucurbitae TaxID=56453 RepID=A0A2S7DA11_9XANT|nr:hypothetical protein XcuCFBP2542_18550 [Xanthomonas cucurbitae]
MNFLRRFRLRIFVESTQIKASIASSFLMLLQMRLFFLKLFVIKAWGVIGTSFVYASLLISLKSGRTQIKYRGGIHGLRVLQVQVF